MTPTAFNANAATLGFAHGRLDRLANRRDDASFLRDLAAEGGARTLLVVEDAVLVKPHASGGAGADPWFSFAEADRLGRAEERVFLGRDDQGPAFGTLLDPAAADQIAARSDIGSFNLRQVALDGSVSAADLGSLAEGKALLFWHAKHRFCSHCGAATRAAASGWRRECASCATHHFPRTDPVVIMLATDGDRCLLGRQPRFPAGMYSCLAGFVEPGETLEDAVRREIAEEAGIATGAVTYLGSQPWPFPASLMIGCLAEARSTAVTVDREELEDARWFGRDEARAMLEGRHPHGLACPFPMAIAHHILRTWADGGT